MEEQGLETQLGSLRTSGDNIWVWKYLSLLTLPLFFFSCLLQTPEISDFKCANLHQNLNVFSKSCEVKLTSALVL